MITYYQARFSIDCGQQFAGNDENARLLSADIVKESEVEKADRLTRKAYAAVNRIKQAGRKRNLFPDLEKEEESDQFIYAFFVLAEV